MKRRFVIRSRPRGGQWKWLDIEPMTKRQAENYRVVLRLDGCDTQVWPEDEARAVIEKEKEAAS